MSLNKLSAQDISKQIKTKKLSAVEALDFFIARIETHNPTLNAVVATRFDEARAEAQQADAKQARGEPLQVLHGVPMTIKDAFEVEGVTCDVGAPNFAGKVSTQSSLVVERLRHAGAIIIGKTNTPIFCSDWQSFNAVHGTSNNPYHLEHTPGGSSGGAAAALAAGLTPMEYGSDIGGSIRVPAHYCGLFGHKPTHGLVPQIGHVPPVHGALAEGDLAVVGPLAKTVDDLETLFDATLGTHGPMAQAMQIALQGPRFETAQGLRVGIWADDAFCAVDTEIAAAIEAAGKTLETLGAEVKPVKPDFDLAWNTQIYALLLNPIMGRGFSDSIHQRMQKTVDAASDDDMSYATLQARGIRLLHKDWLMWDEHRAQLAAKWQAYFQQVDVLLCPVSPTPAIPHMQEPNVYARPFSVNGETRGYMENIVWPGVATVCNLPATSVPLPPHSSGLPMGMQIIGPAYEDKTPIGVARLLEQAGYGFQAPRDFA
ncbi:MAG: amidase [Rhodobiaceae bacterium]|nr:amidase [Rhodobiaceae bacterium]